MSETYFAVKVSELTSKIEALAEYLAENWDSPDSEEIADIMGIAKTKTIEVDVVVRGTATLTMPINYDVDDLKYLSGSVGSLTLDDHTIEVDDSDLEVSEISER